MNYVTKGLRSTGKGFDCLYVGDLVLDKSRSVYTMNKPQMVIGSDRLELYEFFGRRKEVYSIKIRQLIKISAGITFAHAIMVQVPTLMSRFFGDDVSNAAVKLGA